MKTEHLITRFVADLLPADSMPQADYPLRLQSLMEKVDWRTKHVRRPLPDLTAIQIAVFFCVSYLRQMAKQRLKQSATRIANIEKAYSRLKAIRQRAEELRARRPTSAHLLDYYDALLNKYEVQLAKARFIHQIALDRFGQAR